MHLDIGKEFGQALRFVNNNALRRLTQKAKRIFTRVLTGKRVF